MKNDLVSQNSVVNIGPNRLFQDYNEGDFVCINIRGKKFMVLKENFERFPDTRLGKLVKCEMLQVSIKVFGLSGQV